MKYVSTVIFESDYLYIYGFFTKELGEVQSWIKVQFLIIEVIPESKIESCRDYVGLNEKLICNEKFNIWIVGR